MFATHTERIRLFTIVHVDLRLTLTGVGDLRLIRQPTLPEVRGRRTAAYAQGYGVPGRSEREQGDVRTTSNFKRVVKLDWLNQSSLHKYTSNPAGNRD